MLSADKHLYVLPHCSQLIPAFRTQVIILYGCLNNEKNMIRLTNVE
jgi:hypothetical protein